MFTARFKINIEQERPSIVNSEEHDKHKVNIVGNDESFVLDSECRLVTGTNATENTSLIKTEAISNISFKHHFPLNCLICKDKMISSSHFHQHQIQVHGLKLRKGNRIKHPSLTPDIYDPNFYCKACEMTWSSNSPYYRHLRTVHRMKFSLKKYGPKNDSIPDVNNPEFYCSTCEIPYDKQKYRPHLRHAHKIKLNKAVFPKRKIKNPNILPEWNDPNKYCRSCEYTFKTKTTFHVHCTTKHHMKPPAIVYPDYNDPNFNCKVCCITLPNKNTFWNHCKFFHRRVFGVKIRHPDIDPDISDPNHHCRSCEKTLSDEASYKRHLQFVHQILGPPSFIIKPKRSQTGAVCKTKFYCFNCDEMFRKKSAFKRHFVQHHQQHQVLNGTTNQPDLHDPNFYCRVCKKTYAARRSYQLHLRAIHWMKWETSKFKQHDPNVLPNLLDPDFYCRSCKETYSNLNGYRMHCKTIHDIKLINPDESIDIDSPDFYCARCNQKMDTRSKFVYHMTRQHKLVLPASTPSIALNVNDSNFYCPRCDKYPTSRSNFHTHLRKTHNIIVKRPKCSKVYVEIENKY